VYHQIASEFNGLISKGQQSNNNNYLKMQPDKKCLKSKHDQEKTEGLV